LKGLNYNVSCDEKVLELISKVGFDETYGARPIKRAIQDKIEDFVSEEVLNGVIVENEEYVLTVEEEKIIFKNKEVKKTKKKKGTE
jgi:ATP-dependent Clp protease ATP-binding subunit ClpC